MRRAKLLICALAVVNLLFDVAPAGADVGDGSAGAIVGTTTRDGTLSPLTPTLTTGSSQETWTGTWVASDEEGTVVFTGSVEVELPFTAIESTLVGEGVYEPITFSGITFVNGCAITIEGIMTDGQFERVGSSTRARYEEEYEVHQECPQRRARGRERGERETKSAFGAGPEIGNLSQSSDVGTWVGDGTGSTL